MEKKLQIIETPDYILAVSDESVTALFPNYYWNYKDKDWYKFSEDLIDDMTKEDRPIIAYQPKHKDAPELDLPLLPETAVEDDIQNFIVPLLKKKGDEDNRIDLNAYALGLIDAYKATTKVYNEDLHKLLSDFYVFATEGEVCNHITINDFIQSLKQHKTPKWFVAEMEISHKGSGTYTMDLMDIPMTSLSPIKEFKTTTNEQTLKGYYLWT